MAVTRYTKSGKLKKRNGDLTILEIEFVRCYGIEMMKADRVVNVNDLFKAYELKFKEYTIKNRLKNVGIITRPRRPIRT